MSTIDNVNQDISKSLKSGDFYKANVLKMLKNSLDNAIKANSELGEEEVLKIVRKEVRSRQEAQKIYLENNAPDRADKEAKEIEIIKAYAPLELSRQQIENEVDKLVAANHEANFGIIMKLAMTKLGNQADGKLVSEIIKTKLGG